MSKFQENHNAVLILNTIEEENAVVVFIESGILHLKNSEIENAINDFKLALSIDPYNKTALYNITLAFSIDCEINARNCDETFEYFERLKKLDEGSVSEELEVRMVVIEEKMKKRWKE
jgi:tetratricopeptide (TPR) repeat protein